MSETEMRRRVRVLEKAVVILLAQKSVGPASDNVREVIGKGWEEYLLHERGKSHFEDSDFHGGNLDAVARKVLAERK